MAKTTDNTQTEQPEAGGAGAPVTFEDMAEDAVEQILAHDPDADDSTEGEPSSADLPAGQAGDKAAPGAAASGSPPAVDLPTGQAGAKEDQPSSGDLPAGQAGVDPVPTNVGNATPTEPDAQGEAAPEAAPKPTVGSVWAHVPEDVRRKVLAIARKADGQRAAPAAEDGTGTDQPPAAETDKPVVDVAEEVLSGTLTRDEVTDKIEAVRGDGYDDLADALEATADFAAQQTRDAGDAVRAVVNLVEAIDRQQVTEEQDEQDLELFVDAMSTRPGATDDQLILVHRMVTQGLVTPAEGENPYDLAFQQLEGAGVSLGAGESAAGGPKGESDAKRQRRKLAAAASSSSDAGGAETVPQLEGFDQESILQAMKDGDPLFASLQEQS